MDLRVSTNIDYDGGGEKINKQKKKETGFIVRFSLYNAVQVCKSSSYYHHLRRNQFAAIFSEPIND